MTKIIFCHINSNKLKAIQFAKNNLLNLKGTYRYTTWEIIGMTYIESYSIDPTMELAYLVRCQHKNHSFHAPILKRLCENNMENEILRFTQLLEVYLDLFIEQ